MASENQSVKVEKPSVTIRNLDSQSERGEAATATTELAQAQKPAEGWSNLMLNTWFIEWVSWTVAACSFAAIVAMLSVFDGRKLPEIPMGITLNTLLNVLGTIATTALMVPISQGISQLKWIWFTGSHRKITDFEAFDSASRGTLGSISLILKLKFKDVSCFGAFIAILILAASSVTQQSIHYVSRLVPDIHGSAFSPRSTSYNGYTLLSNFGVESSAIAAVYTAILSPHKALAPFSPLCSTGNCTWPEYQTLGVCSAVADISHRFEGYCPGYDTCKASSPEGLNVSVFSSSTYELQPVGVKPNYAKELQPNLTHVPSFAFEDMQHSSLVDFLVFFGNSPKLAAYEINLHPCVQSLQTNVTNGRVHTTTKELYSNFTLHLNDNTDPPLVATLPTTGESFHISSHFVKFMRKYLDKQFKGVITSSKAGAYSGSDAVGLQAIYDLAPQDGNGEVKLGAFADHLAASLSKHFLAAAAASNDVAGTAYSSQTFVRIAWAWLCVLAFVVLATLVFLISVIIVNNRKGCKLWKGSSLATLKAMDSYERPSDWTSLQDLAVMEEQAKTVDSHLGTHWGGWALTAGDSTTRRF